MVILVTGGAGFIGSHLCERLLSQGNEVLCVDNCISGSKENIHHLLDRDDFEFIRHDITQPLRVEVDRIYNLACPASPVKYQLKPVQTVKASVNGAINMLGLARRTGARILQASTSEVYGDPEVHPQKEDYWGHVNPIGPRACYDEGKRCAETLVFDYARQYGINAKVARIFNTYGPRMLTDDGRVVSNFIVQALKGEDITLYGTGSQTRSFCYVDDLVKGLIMLMESEADYPVNLGNPEEISILQLARKIGSLTNSKSHIELKDLPKDDPKRRCPDITLANQLGWEPETSLEVGLKKTISYFKYILGSSVSQADVSKAEKAESNVSL